MIRKIASVAEVAYLHVLVYSGLTNQVNQNASMRPGHRKVISRVLSMSARSSVSAGLLTKQKGDCLWNVGSVQSVNMFMTLPLVILIVESLPEPHLNHCPMIGAAHCVVLVRMYLKKSNNLLLFLIESPRLRGLFLLGQIIWTVAACRSVWRQTAHPDPHGSCLPCVQSGMSFL